MDMYNSYCVIIGVIAVGMGVYVLFTKKLVGRNTGSASKETIRKFLPIEVGTYIVEGLILMLMGMPQRFPFMDNTTVILLVIALAIAILVANVVLSRKFFPDAKSSSPRDQSPRLK